MIKSIKIKLKPNNKQRTKLVQYANTARFAYNWAIGKEQENYKNGGKFIYDNDLRKEFTQLKKQEDYLWLNDTGIGIDLGLKELAICSDCVMYKNINKTHEVKKLEKRKHRLQRKVSNKYELNKKGKEYCRTNHIKKLEQQLLKLNHRLTNIRHDYTHQVTSEIVKRKPSFIVLEDLNVSGMMKKQYLSKAVQQQSFYEFRRQMEYKCEWYKIDLVIADRWFPSSKLCSCCGNIKRDLKLKDRIYKCSCGNTMDRDYQASLNLMKYGKRELEKQSVDESQKRYYR